MNPTSSSKVDGDATTGMELTHNDMVIRIRQRLNSERVKLWLPPYTVDGGEISSDAIQVCCLTSVVLAILLYPITPHISTPCI